MSETPAPGQGRQGEAGPAGREGAAGRSGPAGRDGLVGERGAAGAAGARGRPGMHLSDRRFLIIYVLLVGVLCFGVWSFTTSIAEFKRESIANCEALNASHVKINVLIDQIVQAASLNEDRTPAERAQAIETYKGLHLAILPCPRR